MSYQAVTRRLLRPRGWPIFLALTICLPALATDTDGDGVLDAYDNCLQTANARQIDADGDGWGNFCDADYDNDGIIQFMDLALLIEQMFTSDPVIDLNSDGIVNAVDVGLFRSMLFEAPGPAGFANWTNAGGGDWSAPDNWYPAVLPSAQAHVRIDLPGSFTVTLDSSTQQAQVASVTAAHPLLVSGGTLQVNGAFDSSASVILADGVLSVTGVLSVADLAIAGGQLDDAGVLSGNPVVVTSQHSRAHGVTFMSDVLIENGAHLNIEEGLTLADADVFLTSEGNASFLKFDGTQQLGGDGRIVFGGDVPFDNSNRLWQTVSGDTLTIDSGIRIEADTAGGRIGNDALDATIVFHGNAVIALAGRQIRFDGQFDNHGSIQASDGARLVFAGPWNNYGTVRVEGGEFETLAGPDEMWLNAGVIELIDTPATLGGSLTPEQLAGVLTDAPLTIAGVVQNTAGTLDTDDFPAGLTLDYGGAIVGGEVTGERPLRIDWSVSSATSAEPTRLAGVTLSTDTIVRDAIVAVYDGLTLEDSTVMLISAPPARTRLDFHGTQTLGGSGTVAFGEPSPTYTGLASLGGVNEDSVLTISEDITLLARDSAAYIGRFRVPMVMNGTLLAQYEGASSIWLPSHPLDVGGSIHIGALSSIRHTVFNGGPASEALIFGADATLDIDIGPDGHGALELRDGGVLAGTLNLALIDGVQVMPCDEFAVITYPDGPVVGMFDAVNSGGALDVRAFGDELVAVANGSACEFETNHLLGTVADASSNAADVDNINDDFSLSTWCSDATDEAPRVSYELPASFDFSRVSVQSDAPAFETVLVGLFNAEGKQVFASDSVSVEENQTAEIVVPDSVPSARRLELLASPAAGSPGCLRELNAFGAEPRAL